MKKAALHNLGCKVNFYETEAMKEILENIETNNPGQMAKQVLEHILLYTAGKVPDDMTVLAAGIWEK